MTGEGSDEALGGYDIFRELKIRTFCEADPGSSRRPKLFSKLYPFLDPRKGDGSLLGSIMMRRIDPRWSRIASHSSRWASLRNTTRLLSDDFRISDPSAALEAFDRTLPAEFDRWHPLNRAQFVEAKTLTSGYLLSAQGDRMSMRHSVEARFPSSIIGSSSSPTSSTRGSRFAASTRSFCSRRPWPPGFQHPCSGGGSKRIGRPAQSYF